MRVLSLFLLLLIPQDALQAKPAAWYWWSSQLNQRLICQQTSPGPAWTKLRQPYRDARCQEMGKP
ncbi:hypothetical protein [Azonexus sp.]|uniref:hypothetical protein n=1 Tax=Azonexus sp. TaxID=1872668 RepID=UPI0039E69A3B